MQIHSLDVKRKDTEMLHIDSLASLRRVRSSLLKPMILPADSEIYLSRTVFGTDAGEYEDELNDLYLDCGCESGAITVLLTILGLIGVWLISGLTLEWKHLAIAIAALFAAAIVGKGFGLLRRLIRMMHLLTKLEFAAKRHSKKER